MKPQTWFHRVTCKSCVPLSHAHCRRPC